MFNWSELEEVDIKEVKEQNSESFVLAQASRDNVNSKPVVLKITGDLSKENKEDDTGVQNEDSEPVTSELNPESTQDDNEKEKEKEKNGNESNETVTPALKKMDGSNSQNSALSLEIVVSEFSDSFSKLVHLKDENLDPFIGEIKKYHKRIIQLLFENENLPSLEQISELLKKITTEINNYDFSKSLVKNNEDYTPKKESKNNLVRGVFSLNIFRNTAFPAQSDDIDDNTAQKTDKAEFLSLLKNFEYKIYAAYYKFENETIFLKLLPMELWYEVFSYFLLKEQAKVSNSCQFFNNLYHNPAMHHAEGANIGSSEQKTAKKAHDLKWMPRKTMIEQKLNQVQMNAVNKNPEEIISFEEAYHLYRSCGENSIAESYLLMYLQKKLENLRIRYSQFRNPDPFVLSDFGEYMCKVFFAEKDYQKSLFIYEFIENKFKYLESDYKLRYCRILNLAGMAHFMLGNYTKAEKMFVRILKSNTETFFPYVNRNLLYTRYLLGKNTFQTALFINRKGCEAIHNTKDRSHISYVEDTWYSFDTEDKEEVHSPCLDNLVKIEQLYQEIQATKKQEKDFKKEKEKEFLSEDKSANADDISGEISLPSYSS